MALRPAPNPGKRTGGPGTIFAKCGRNTYCISSLGGRPFCLAVLASRGPTWPLLDCRQPGGGASPPPAPPAGQPLEGKDRLLDLKPLLAKLVEDLVHVYAMLLGWLGTAVLFRKQNKIRYLAPTTSFIAAFPMRINTFVLISEQGGVPKSSVWEP